MRLALSSVLSMILALTSAVALAGEAAPDLAGLRRIAARSAPVDISADLSRLERADRDALAEIIRAAKVMDPVFLDQEWSDNQAMLLQLARDDSPLGRARLALFLQMRGPWDRDDNDRPFIPGAPPKPQGANFYPPDATKEELTSWMAGLPDASVRQAQSRFTVVRRLPKGGFASVPYSLLYASQFKEAAGHLRAAAAETSEASLKAYLLLRAAALAFNDYRDSGQAFLNLDTTILADVGPYAWNEDAIFGLKASCGAFVALRDDAEMGRWNNLAAQFKRLVGLMPDSAFGDTPRPSAPVPLLIGDLVYAAGVVDAGSVEDHAHVFIEGYARRILFKNVVEARHRLNMLPMAKAGLSPDLARAVSLEASLTYLEAHEFVIGLGRPTMTGPHGEKEAFSQELRENYPAIEWARVDATTLWALQQLMEQGALDKGLERPIYATVLAWRLSSLQTSGGDAQGAALELNFLLDRGAVVVGRDGRLAIDSSRMKEAVASLMNEMGSLEAKGKYLAAKEIVERLGPVRSEEQRILERTGDVPLGVKARYVSAQALLAQP